MFFVGYFRLAALVLASGALVLADGATPGCWEVLKAAFPRIDRDKDGSLSLAEIDQSVADPGFRGAEAAGLVALRRGIRAHKAEKGPWRWDDLERLAKNAPVGKSKPPDLESYHRAALRRIAAADSGLFGPAGPRLESIHQGRLGDCFCLAPLGAMTHRDPWRVRWLFTEARDGVVSVRIGGETVEVPPLTDGEKALVASTSGEGRWVPLYEKAMGILIARKKGMGTPLGSVGSGGSTGTALSLLTGKPIERFSLKDWKQPGADRKSLEPKLAKLREGLGRAMAEGRLVCGGTGANVKVPGVNGNHAYAVLAYDLMSDKVTFWNPHGQTFNPKGPEGTANGYRTRKGVFEAPLNEVAEWFGGFSWEKPGA